MVHCISYTVYNIITRISKYSDQRGVLGSFIIIPQNDLIRVNTESAFSKL